MPALSWQGGQGNCCVEVIMKIYVHSISFIELLALLFIGLKLTGYMALSWFWILSPIIVKIAVIVAESLTNYIRIKLL